MRRRVTEEEKFVLETLIELHQRQKIDVYNLHSNTNIHFVRCLCSFEYKFS